MYTPINVLRVVLKTSLQLAGHGCFCIEFVSYQHYFASVTDVEQRFQYRKRKPSCFI